MSLFSIFVSDETGQVTIEWVGLTAGILLVGIAVVWSIYGRGVEPLTADINTDLQTHYSEIDAGEAPDFR